MRICLISVCILCFSIVGYSQGHSEIMKFSTQIGDANKKDKTYRSQKLYYVQEDLVSEVSYSYNGWQVNDSIVYSSKLGELCIENFTPVYDIDNKSLKHYTSEGIICDSNISIENSIVTRVEDSYLLSMRYIDHIDLLMSFYPVLIDNNYRFEECVIPSIFTEYGIPFDACLNYFSFHIDQNNLIMKDSYHFDNYTVLRLYTYVDSTLQKVNIKVSNNSNTVLNIFEDKFEF